MLESPLYDTMTYDGNVNKRYVLNEQQNYSTHNASETNANITIREYIFMSTKVK